MLRNPRGPEGRNNNPYHHPDLHRSSRQDAGVELACPASLCEPQDAASMHKLNAHAVSSARRRRHLRTTGAAGRGVDAQTRNANTRHIRARASACPNDKEAGRMAASIVYFVSGRDGAKTTHCVSK